ncbi:uncharacterized protein NPIL_32591, partial [Nephila pilipes]
RVEGLQDYVRGPGYNACANIFQTPLEHPIPVQVVSYFYLMQRAPVTYLQYESLNASNVIAPLRSVLEEGSLQIGQEFPYDYMQVFFRERQHFTGKIRQFTYNEIFYERYPSHFIRKPSPMEWCRFMSRHLKEVFLPAEWSFNLLYQFPVCYIGKHDQAVPEQYRGRYVSNPLHLTYRPHGDPQLYNGVVLKYNRGEWTLDFASEYKINTYRSVVNSHMVPFLNDPIIEMLEQGYMSKIPIDEQNTLYRAQEADRRVHNEPTF